MNYNITEINHLIRNRRSVFPDQFEAGKQIPEEIIKDILENALWAPNHAHTEPWQFTVFSGEGLQKFATFQSELFKQEAGERFNEGKYNKLKTQPLKASHIVAIGMKRSPTKKVPEIEEVEAVACAVQNLHLSVTAHGLGGYWTSGGITYSESAKSFFGLGEEDRLLGFFYIAYVAVPSPSAKRKGLDEKVTWVKY